MSADNGIYILHTKDKFKKTGDCYYENMWDKRIDAYRVAHTQAVDSFEWYIEHEIHNLGEWMSGVFGGSPIFYDLNEARDYAYRLAEKYEFLEYGVGGVVDASDYNFPGC